MRLSTQFAHEAYRSIDHRRKYTQKPYEVHTDAVRETIVAIGGTDDMISAADTHDVIEDVFPKNPHYDIYLIAKTLGEATAKLVVELTDVYTSEAYPDLNRAQRKALEVERLAKTSAAAQTIKLADIIDNTKDIVKNDQNFAYQYLKEKEAVLRVLTKGNPVLRELAEYQLMLARQANDFVMGRWRLQSDGKGV